MARPHIEFLQSQHLPWRGGVPGGFLRDVESKVLSHDDDTGDCTCVVRFPPGRSSGEGLAERDEEAYVLDGNVDVDGQGHAAHSYAFLPAGTERRYVAGPAGAVVLLFLSTRPGAHPQPAAVLGHGTVEQAWQATFTEGLPPGAARKDLRRDAATGEETWVLGTMPMRWGVRPERHPVVEEMFLVSGTLVGPLGTMQPGAYFWRPAGAWHGPFGSLTGTVDLFRTVGGPLQTEWGAPQHRFDWAPEHRPVLPPDRSGGAEPPPQPAPY